MEKRMNPEFRRPVTVLRILPALISVFLIAALVMPVAASPSDEKGKPEQHAPEAASAESAEPSAVARDGMKVFVDPETGKVMEKPSRQQTEALSPELAKALSRSTEGLRVFDLPNGGKGVDLDGRFQHVLMVRVRPDGSLETVCVNHRHEAEKPLQRKSAEDDSNSRDK
jgi:hypothetical protein